MKPYPTLWSVMAILACAALSVMTPASQPVRAAGLWYVTPGGSDANTCTAPSTACATINGALNKPGFIAGDMIQVATGVYAGAGDQVVLLDKSATLSGGWDTGFTMQNGVSIIDGERARRGITVNSGRDRHDRTFCCSELSGFTFAWNNSTVSVTLLVVV